MAATKVLVAADNFAAEVDGVEYIVRAGERVASDRPLAEAHGDSFKPVEPSADLTAPKRPRRSTKT